MNWNFQPTVNTDGEGVWRTTDDGSRIFIKDGKAYAGGPGGKELGSKGGKKAAKTKSGGGSSSKAHTQEAQDAVRAAAKGSLKFGKNEAEFDTETLEDLLSDSPSGPNDDEIEVRMQDFLDNADGVLSKNLGPGYEKKIAQMIGAPSEADVTMVPSLKKNGGSGIVDVWMNREDGADYFIVDTNKKTISRQPDSYGDPEVTSQIEAARAEAAKALGYKLRGEGPVPKADVIRDPKTGLPMNSPAPKKQAPSKAKETPAQIQARLAKDFNKQGEALIEKNRKALAEKASKPKADFQKTESGPKKPAAKKKKS